MNDLGASFDRLWARAPLIPSERRSQILKLVETRSSVSVPGLCDLLDVSEMTIRRDLRVLADQGLLLRVHGGAVSRRGRSYEPPYLIRSTERVDAKAAIGQAAAHFVQEGDSIALDVGTTTLEVAKNLAGTPNLTILTASLTIANVLADFANIRLMLTGGMLRDQERSMVGNIAARTFGEFQTDKAFIGIGGIHPSVGLTEYNHDDALIKQAIIAHTEQVIVVADSLKILKTCFALVAPLSVVDVLVTDSHAPADVVQQFQHAGVEVILVPAPGADGTEPES